MRKLATIRVIEEVLSIEGADKIEKVRIGGWMCVAKIGEFKAGDKCLYIEVDSLLPIKEPFLFLENKGRKKTLIDGIEHEGYRLKTLKLREQISQGLALPLSSFPGISENVGDDVSDFIGVLKYEPPVPACLSGDVEGSFPGFLVKSDEERIQNIFNDMAPYYNSRLYVSEKLDGSSMSVYKYQGEFGVCSRNLRLKENETNSFWRLAHKYDLKNKLPEGWSLQAEAIGEGIQGNPLKQTGQDCYVFYVIEIATQKYLQWPDMVKFVTDLGMKTVPLVDDNFIIGSRTCEDLLAMADRKSVLNPNEILEGLVFRLYDSTEKITFKTLSNKYLLKTEG